MYTDKHIGWWKKIIYRVDIILFMIKEMRVIFNMEAFVFKFTIS